MGILNFLFGWIANIFQPGTVSYSGLRGILLDEKGQKIQKEIIFLMNNESYANYFLHCKEGGVNGVPASSLTVKYILMYLAGVRTGIFPNLGDVEHPEGFDRIVGGNAGVWTLSKYPVSSFQFPYIDRISLDEGNDFGLRRHVGTWLEETFDVSCLVASLAAAGVAIGTAAATAATGGAAAPTLLANSVSITAAVNSCRKK